MIKYTTKTYANLTLICAVRSDTVLYNFPPLHTVNISKRFEEYRFQSPQVIKHVVADQLYQELIFDTFVQTLENNKVYSTVAGAVRSFLGLNKAA